MRTITLLCFFAGSAAHASFLASSQSVVFDPQTKLLSFDIEFNEVPDFTTVDVNGPANYWQIRAMRAGGTLGNNAYDSIVQIAGNQIIVRTNPGFPVDTACEFTLSGTTITFTAPLSAVAPSHPDGIFQYEFLSWDHGVVHQMDHFFYSQVASTPEPGTMITAAVALLLVIFYRRKNNWTVGSGVPQVDERRV